MIGTDKLVLIKWIDARDVGDGLWHSREEVESTASADMQSVGWVIHETENEIKISADVPLDPDDDEVGRSTVIPKGCVKEIKEL
tara:strand:- start:462 stop:713 length:252 start_codon:yes stop_codon:yes gene_type:complete